MSSDNTSKLGKFAGAYAGTGSPSSGNDWLDDLQRAPVSQIRRYTDSLNSQANEFQAAREKEEEFRQQVWDRLYQHIEHKRKNGAESVISNGTSGGFKVSERYLARRVDPFGVTGLFDVTDANVVNAVVNQIPTDRDLDYVASMMVAEENSTMAKRGILGTAFDIGTEMPAFAASFAMSGGIGRAGASAFAQGMSRAAARAAARAAGVSGVKGVAARAGAAGIAGASKVAGSKIGQVVLRGAAQTPITPKALMPAVSRRTGYQVQADDQGNLYVQDPEDAATMIPKALGDAFIEMASENLGFALSETKAMQWLKNGIASMAAKVLRIPAGQSAKVISAKLAEIGYDGVLEEMIEERAGELARGALGIEEGYGVASDIVEGHYEDAYKQLAAELIAFSVPKAGSMAAGAAADRVINGLQVRAGQPPEPEGIEDGEYLSAWAEANPEQAGKLADLASKDQVSRGDIANAGLGGLQLSAEQRKRLVNGIAGVRSQQPADQQIAPEQRAGDAAPATKGESVPEPATEPESVPEPAASSPGVISYNGRKLTPYKAPKAQEGSKGGVDFKGVFQNAAPSERLIDSVWDNVSNSRQVKGPDGKAGGIFEQAVNMAAEKGILQSRDDVGFISKNSGDPQAASDALNYLLDNAKKNQRPTIQQIAKQYDYNLIEVKPTTDSELAAEELIKQFGKTPVFVRGDEGFNGATNRKSGEVILRVGRDENPFWRTVGHEIAHATGIDELRDLDDELVQQHTAKRIAKAGKKYADKIRNSGNLARREGVASLLGEFFEDSGFRNRLLEEKPPAYKSIANKVVGLLKSFKFPAKAKAEQRLFKELRDNLDRLNHKPKKKSLDEIGDLDSLIQSGIEEKLGDKPAKNPAQKAKKRAFKKATAKYPDLAVSGQYKPIPKMEGFQYVVNNRAGGQEGFRVIASSDPSNALKVSAAEVGATAEEAYDNAINSLRKEIRDKSPKPPKKSNREKADDAKSELDDLFGQFKDKFGSTAPANQFLNPEFVALATKITATAVKAGYYEFRAFVDLATEKLGKDMMLKAADYFEAAWQTVYDNVEGIGPAGSVKEILDGEETTGTDTERTDSGSGTGSTRSGDGEAGSRGSGRTDGEGSGSDSARGPQTDSRGQRETNSTDRQPGDSHSPGNYRIQPGEIGQGGARTKYKNNVAAIKTLHQIESEGRKHATPEEQAILAKYVGWGMFKGAFNKELDQTYHRLSEAEQELADPKKWQDEYDELKALLSPEEWEAARSSTINAHFTSETTVNGMWDIIRAAGFTGGRVLEPSAGSGNFLGLQPEDLAQRTRWNAVEMDDLSAKILRLLYPDSKIFHAPFQDVPFSDDFFDLVVANYPFSDAVKITSDSRFSRMRPNLHDYFLLKSIKLVRPGGLVVTVTSTGTMDKQNSAVRRKIAEEADLVKAIRLPAGAFSKNAGTEVVTDLLIFRKRGKGESPAGPNWFDLKTVPDPDGGKPVPINEYFADNISQVLGQVDRRSRLYGRGQPHVSRTDGFDSMWQDQIESEEWEGVYQEKTFEERTSPQERIERSGQRNGQLTVVKGKLYQVEGESLKPIERKNKTAAQKRSLKDTLQIVEDIEPVRSAYVDVINAQLEGRDDQARSDARELLNNTYDSFVAKHGPISANKVKTALYSKDAQDGDYQLLAALEIYTPEENWNGLSLKDLREEAEQRGIPHDGKKKADLVVAIQNSEVTKSDAFTQDTIRGTRNLKPTTVSESLGIVLNEKGFVDVDRIAELLGKTVKQVEKGLVEENIAFEDPSSGWELKDFYLSGNVREKLKQARIRAATEPRFTRNVEALEKVIPDDVPYDEIVVRPGAPWISPADIAQFAAETLGGQPDNFLVSYSSLTGDWKFRYSNSGERNLRSTENARQIFGTPDVNFVEVMQHALSGTAAKVVRKDSEGNRILDAAATEAANEKIAEVEETFKDWIWTDTNRQNRLSEQYNETFNAYVSPSYDGSHLEMLGMIAPGTKLANGRAFNGLRQHQKNAVWRAILRGKGMLAHEVGTGKTYTMGAIAMELRRLGLANKPSMIVPNARVTATVQEIQEIYPGAKILAASEGMDKKQREKTIAKIASGDWDLVVLTHENIGLMPLSPAMEERYVLESLQEIEELLAEEGVDASQTEKDLKKTSRGNPAVRNLVNMLLAERERLAGIASKRDQQGANFEQTGIDFVIVDEAHAFKGLKIRTRKGNIKGIPTNATARATNLEMITRFLQEQNGGRGVIFATGTPVTNSLAEIYAMQRFIQRDELEKMGVLAFDAWASNFGMEITKIEQTHLGTPGETTRFRAFINLPELQNLVGMDFDIVRADAVSEINRPEKEDRVITVEATESQKRYRENLVARARALQGRPPERGGDNHLKIAFDGTMSAMDMRLIDASDTEGSDSGKAARLVTEMLLLHRENPETTQMVFSEVMRSNETGFDLFNDIKERLIANGIPADKIVDFRGKKGKEKAAAADKIDKREAWFALGSTKTLGTGVNAQSHLIAVHHLEPPWTPDAVEQRVGRAWRQGNKNAKIYSFVYITAPSLDAWKYQLVTHKDRGIKRFFDFGTVQREIEEEDIDDLPSDFATFSAIASGNPLLIESINLGNNIRKLTRGEERHNRARSRASGQIARLKEQIPVTEKAIESVKSDADHWNSQKGSEFEFEGDQDTKTSDRKEAGQAIQQKFLTIQRRRDLGENKLGTFKGFDVFMKLDGFGSANFYVRREGSYAISGESLGSDKPENIFLSIARNLDNMAKSGVERAESSLERIKSDIKSLESIQGKPYRKAAELERDRNRYAEVQRLLAEETQGDIEEDLGDDIGPRGSGLPVLPIQINADEIVKGVKKFVARNFRPRNMLSEEMFETNITRQGRINKHTAELDFNVRDLKRAYRKNADPKRPDRLARQIDAVLKGEANPSILPEEVRGPVQRMRDHLDYLSLNIINSGLLSEASEFVFQDNLGRYLHRSYEVHDNPRYKASEDVKQAARDYIRDDLGGDVTDEQIEHIVNRLSTYTDHPFSPGSGIDGHAEGLVNRSILKYRREIPKPIRDLMGEYRDPIINYVKSITKAAHLLANYQFVNELWEMGEGTIFFDKNDENIDPLATTQFASMGDMRVNPLNGKYARPEVVQAFKDILNHQDMPKWLGRFIQASQAAKYSKTVLSHITHIRNFGSMTFVAVANGHFNPGQFWEAMLTQAEQLGLGNDQARRALYKRLAELGVVNDSYTAGVMREVLKDFNQSHDLNTGVMTPQTMVDSILKGVRNFNRKAQGLYRAEDEIWRIFGFLHEKERYRAAYPQATEEQLDQIAAKIVRDTFPTYSMLPRGMRALRRFPAIGPFVSFPWEMGRVSIATMRLAMTEINSGNPVLVKTGYARLVGMAFAVIAIPTAVSVATAWLFGVGSDDDDDVRHFLADWNKYSLLMWAGRDVAFDMSYMHPYAFMQKPIMAALAGDWKGVLSEAASPYVSEDLFASKLMDLARNQTAQGREVYNQGDSDFEAMQKQIAHLADGMMPGSATSFMRWLHAARGTADENERTYDFMAETIANVFGMRAIKIDIKKSLEWHARRHQNSLSSLTADAKNVFESEGIKSPAELATAVQRMNTRRKALFEEISESVGAAIRLGLTEEEVVDVLADGGIPKSAAMQIVAGEFQPFKLSQISQMDRMTPERAKSFAELTDSETVILAAVARAVHSLGSSSLDREGREKALETIGRFTSSRKQALEMYQSWLRDQVRAGKMSQRSANTRLRAALQQSIPIAK